MAVPVPELEALRTLLNSSLDTYASELKKMEMPLPGLRAPQLHPLDNPLFVPSAELFDAKRQLLASLSMMTSIVQGPAEKAMIGSFAHHTSVALDVAVRTNIADLLAEDLVDPAVGVDVAVLAKRTGMETSRLAKILRNLANQGWFTETRENRFANNRSSIVLRAGSPVRSFVSYQTWWSLGHASCDADALLDPVRGHSNELRHASSVKAWELEKHGAHDMFEFLAKLHPSRVDEFANAMTGASASSIAGLIADYPWADLPAGTTVVDVGGGEGAVSLPLLKSYPHLKGVVQDRPETFPRALKNFEQNLPEAVRQGRIECEAVDFFAKQPRSGDQYVYLMRWILHDWHDQECIKILKTLAKAMTPASRLLVVDAVMVPCVPSDATATTSSDAGPRALDAPPPYPLEASYGDASRFKHLIDQEMTGCLNAKERTVTQFEALFQAAGLRLEKAYPSRGMHSVLEARVQ